MNGKRNVSIKFAVSVNGVRTPVTTDAFKIVYDGTDPEGTLTCKITNRMVPGIEQHYNGIVSLRRDQYGYEVKEKVYEHDVVDFMYNDERFRGVIVCDRDLCMCYINATSADVEPVKVPIYRAKDIVPIGSVLVDPDLLNNPDKISSSGKKATNTGTYTIHIASSGSSGAYIISRFGKEVARKFIPYGNISTNRALLAATCDALTFVLNEQPQNERPQNVIIYSDSDYLVCGASEWSSSWKRNDWTGSTGEDVKNRDIWMRLLQLIDAANASFEYLKDPFENLLGDVYRMAVDKHSAASS